MSFLRLLSPERRSIQGKYLGSIKDCSSATQSNGKDLSHHHHPINPVSNQTRNSQPSSPIPLRQNFKSPTPKMYAIIPTILALATTALAAPSGLEPRACTYETAQYLSVCQQGENLFCTGDVNICPSGKTDTFDAKATSANEAACEGLTMSASCKITVACC